MSLVSIATPKGLKSLPLKYHHKTGSPTRMDYESELGFLMLFAYSKRLMV